MNMELINGLQNLIQKDRFRIEYGIVSSIEDGEISVKIDGIELHNVICSKAIAPKVGANCIVGIVKDCAFLMQCNEITTLEISINNIHIVANESNVVISTPNSDVTIGNKIAISSNGISLKEILSDLTAAIATITPILGVPLPSDIANIARKINTML